MILTPNWTVDWRVRLKCQSERFHSGEYQQAAAVSAAQIRGK